MAFDAFLKIEGIKGESADNKHKGEIDVMSFSWGLSQTGTSATGGGGGSGKAHFEDFHFVKKVDAASPLLMLNCAAGTHIKEANFVVRKAGGEQLEYMKIKLTDVLVSTVKPNALIGLLVPAVITGNLLASEVAKPASDSLPTEEISLNFAKIEFAYQPQGADGKAQGGPILAGYDVKLNQKV